MRRSTGDKCEASLVIVFAREKRAEKEEEERSEFRPALYIPLPNAIIAEAWFICKPASAKNMEEYLSCPEDRPGSFVGGWWVVGGAFGWLNALELGVFQRGQGVGPAVGELKEAVESDGFEDAPGCES
jgi:hypothetical protein